MLVLDYKCKLFNGVVAYDLWSTYGLPLEVTQDYIREKLGEEWRVNQEEFDAARDGHKRKSQNVANA